MSRLWELLIGSAAYRIVRLAEGPVLLALTLPSREPDQAVHGSGGDQIGLIDNAGQRAHPA